MSVTSMKDKEESMQNTINILQNNVTSQKTTINTQRAQLTKHDHDISSLRTGVADLRHIEQGIIDCESSDTWSDETVVREGPYYFFRTRRITQTFSSVYKTPPVVFLATSFRIIPADNNVRYGTRLVDVNTTSFTMMCGGAQGTSYRLSDMEVDWLSIPV